VDELVVRHPERVIRLRMIRLRMIAQRSAREALGRRFRVAPGVRTSGHDMIKDSAMAHRVDGICYRLTSGAAAANTGHPAPGDIWRQVAPLP
jgi:hypothetical protein